MARSLEIPAIVGSKEITAKVNAGDILAVNGILGDVIINPTEDQAAEFIEAGKLTRNKKQNGKN